MSVRGLSKPAQPLELSEAEITALEADVWKFDEEEHQSNINFARAVLAAANKKAGTV